MYKFEVGDIVRVTGREDRWDGHVGEVVKQTVGIAEPNSYHVRLFTVPDRGLRIDGEYYFLESKLEEVD